MSKKKVEKFESVRSTLNKMEVGDTISYPIERLRTIRATASEMGIVEGKTYSTRTSKEERLIYIQRKA